MSVYSWTEIESFHNIRKFMHAYPENLKGNSTVKYACKVKLHGTNAAVQCHLDGKVIAQSRTTELVDGNDNAGFAKWVKENEAAWNLANDLVIYGEWIGPGIQKGVAVSEIPKKCFAVFAARHMTQEPLDQLIVEPDQLQALVAGIPDVYVLPWYSEPSVRCFATVQIDWTDTAENLTVKVDQINNWVMAIEANDPWVEATFGVKGTGEGLVFYPTSQEHLGISNYNNLVFKAKGEKHKNIKTAAPAQVDATAAASTAQFVDMVLTDARLEQGATAVAGTLSFDMKLVGKFIAWVVADVEKETQDELTASNLTWKQVQKPVGDRARAWYIEQFKKL